MHVSVGLIQPSRPHRNDARCLRFAHLLKLQSLQYGCSSTRILLVHCEKQPSSFSYPPQAHQRLTSKARMWRLRLESQVAASCRLLSMESRPALDQVEQQDGAGGGRVTTYAAVAHAGAPAHVSNTTSDLRNRSSEASGCCRVSRRRRVDADCIDRAAPRLVCEVHR